MTDGSPCDIICVISGDSNMHISELLLDPRHSSPQRAASASKRRPASTKKVRDPLQAFVDERVRLSRTGEEIRPTAAAAGRVSRHNFDML